MIISTLCRDYYSQKKFNKILPIISFILLLSAILIIAVTPPTSSYELSVYDVYPWYFWLTFLGANFLAITIILAGVFTEKKTNQWIFGFFLILIGNFILLFLPFFRGYCFYGGANDDIFTHIGWIKEISWSAHVSETNFYPVIHIFTLSLSSIVGVPVTSMIQVIPAFFSLLYSPFIFLLAKSISSNKHQILLITCFSFPLMFSFFQITMKPVLFSFIFIPFLLFLYYKRNSSKRKVELSIIIVIFCFFIVFFHPMTALIAIIIFITFMLSSILLRKVKPSLTNNTINNQSPRIINIILILNVVFFAWFTYHSWGVRSIRILLQGFFYSSKHTIFSYYVSNLISANLSIYQTIQLFVIKYGPILIYIIIAFSSLIFIVKNFIFSRKVGTLEFSYGLQFIIASFIAAVLMLGHFIVIEPVRCLLYLIMIATIVNGFFIYTLLSGKIRLRKKILTKKLLYPITVIVLFFTTTVCIFNIYSSPLISETNAHFTYKNLYGSVWFTENRDKNIQISTDVGFNLWRMEHYMNGITKGDINTKKRSINTPSHFGYTSKNNTLSQVFNSTRTYLITTEKGRQAVYAFPENIRQIVHQWTIMDFAKLKNDQAVYLLYTNGEFEVWQIYPR
jgi:hypothetical protein